MNHLTTTLFLFFSLAGLGQYTPTLRPGTLWFETTYLAGSSDPCHTAEFVSGRVDFVGEDTTIAGEVYKKIRSYTFFEGDSAYAGSPCFYFDYEPVNSIVSAYLREDEVLQRVYMRDTVYDTTYCIYDYDPSIGDILSRPGYADFVVASINTIDVNGSTRKVITGQFGVTYTEGIGSEFGLFQPLQLTFSGLFSEVCVRHDHLNEYGICNFFLTAEESPETSFTLFPNPASNSIQITRKTTEPELLQIYSALGQLVLTSLLQGYQSDITLNTLTPGIYFCKTAESGTVRLIVE